MKTIQEKAYTLTGMFLAWVVCGALYVLLILPWFTARFYAKRIHAKLNESFGSPEYKKNVMRWMADYSRVCVWVFERVMFMDIKVRRQTGKKIRPGESHVIISNHISWFDTAFYPGLCARLGLHNVIFVPKKEFREHWLAYYVLTIAWEDAGFPFVDRENPEEAISIIRTASLIAKQHGFSLLTFCEGTRPENVVVGKPKWRGFAAQVELFNDSLIVSLTQCSDKPVGKTILSAHTYFLRTLIVDVQTYDPLPKDTNVQAWLEQEFTHKEKLILAVRE